MLCINNFKCSLSEDETLLSEKLSAYLKCSIRNIQILKKAIDARSRKEIWFVYNIAFSVDNEALLLKQNIPYVSQYIPIPEFIIPPIKKIQSPVIIGSGPAGMFAALVLAQAGVCPIILERGPSIDKRCRDVKNFWHGGKLKTQSNVQFGEGGAGTFSDGKLMTGIKKDAMTMFVLKELVKAGAPNEILYISKPHLGTDKLVNIVRNIRAKIISLGGEYRFEHQLDDIQIQNNQIRLLNIKYNEDEQYELPVQDVILALGHSARDTFEMLHNRGVPIIPKSFSIGVRIEHPQSLINRAIYHDFCNNPKLSAADYKLAVHLPNGRSAYSFCMCPGGVVVAAASEKEQVVTNGMSYYARDGENANAALLVGVTPSDFGGNHPLQGVYWQKQIENRAFCAGDKSYAAPAQRLEDMLKRRSSVKAGEVIPSYSRGVVWGSMDYVLPTFVMDTFRLAINEMDKKLHGYNFPDAVMTGVETRSSSPIRIIREEDMQSPVKGLYPAGEGAGYAGGIVSSAVDGIKAALGLLQKYVD